MKVLTLVRHAKSSWDYPELPDFERPLSARGRKDAPAMAALLKKAKIRPERLVSSPALRAITTARLFAVKFGIEPESIHVSPHIYEASPQTLMHIVRSLMDLEDDVMLIGHNPGISRFARQLADCPFDEMPTCAAVRIEFPAKTWSMVRAGTGTVLRYDYPKKDREN